MKFIRFFGRWVLPSLFGILFVLIGSGKMRAPGWEENFLRWGFPPGAHIVVGGIEIMAGLALLFPKLSSWAASVLGIVMVGAVGTHLVWGETDRLFTPILYMVLLALVGYARRGRRLGAPVIGASAHLTM
jgi:putative oxidoreductase